ncbi:mannose-1-phosphate guanylyltransferase/mannose-6-phosphate isomerase [Alkalilacustris brevis]|uniref:mannose-1-phosphate guanylyltransferase/mannose-6-phosphate isomerase n=1 Tax=Alkalilacustris brevis TaxID=2026338 RepID=UPI000E0DED0A|nr:mannose-1-phosphate guanylyltransferase/mannose-6-phosphate isomerase [Alkalilacustris brevis]
MPNVPVIHPVILCGGSGTRLWPLSRRSYPKQFMPLIGETTLFQASAQRVAGAGFAPPLVLTNSDFRFIVTEQLTTLGIDPGAVLIEPEGRNTAPAVLAAALWLSAQEPDALMLVMPSDHVVPDAAGFREAVATGADAARAGRLVTFGIRPDRPETGYGYLEPEENGAAPWAARPLARFIEKPDAARAEAMLAAGHFLWNAGIFLFSARAIIAAFEAHAPALITPVRRAVEEARPDLGFLRLAPGPWAEVENISIDYAVMERAGNLSVVPFQGGWSDLGDWQAVWRETPPDADGVAQAGPVTALECRESLLRAESPEQELVGIGLDHIIAIAMPDAVLVADRRRSQEVKAAVATLAARGRPQATQLPVDHRPWGWFEAIASGNHFQVKRIVVHPGAALSLQSHHHRAEHWVVVTGTARVTIDEKVHLLGENDSIYVPLGARHRLENPGKIDMVLIEVQTGSYLGEDDIIRYDDAYARNTS